MNNNYISDIKHNYNLSIIIPILDFHCFILTIEKNVIFFQKNGLEIILVVNNNLKESILSTVIDKNRFINWVLITTEENETCRIAKMINTGLFHSKRKYILTIPDNLFFEADAIYSILHLLHRYENAYITNFEENLVNQKNNLVLTGKDVLMKIGGYDETIFDFNLLNVNLCRRLDMLSMSRIYYEIKNISTIKIDNFFENNISLLKRSYYPSSYFAKNQISSNLKIFFDSNNHVFQNEWCREYLKNFEKYWLNKDAFYTKYSKVLLCQSYNEGEHIADFLEHMSNYFDAIILLDDGSSDNTYEIAVHEKLIIKFKNHRLEFNDLKNRNTLLNVASFIRSDWLCFMDIDERFDPKHVDFFDNLDQIQADNIGFLFVHLWNSVKEYNIKIYEKSYQGIFLRWRMFRNIGKLSIHSSNKLHFNCSPLFYPMMITPVLVHHFGYLNKERRHNKFNFYLKEDTQKDQKNYDILLDEGQTRNTDSIGEDIINRAIIFFNKI